MRSESEFWTNPTVAEFAAGDDPVGATVSRVKDVVFNAVLDGWDGPPFDPLGLARRLGIEVVARDDLNDARVIGLDEGRFRLEYNPNRPRGRLRFSIAHEIAHTFFPFADSEIRHRTSDGAVEVDNTDDWQLELLCNIAAGELLVPELALPVEQLDRVALDIDQLMVLRARFDVSTEAILRRTAQSTNHAVTMFAAARLSSEGNPVFRIDYSVGSAAWDPRILRGARVSSKVLAECTAVGFTSTGTERWNDATGVVTVQAAGIPPYPRERLPRVAGLLVRDESITQHGEITYVTGDATTPHGDGPRIIAHIVNNVAHAWGGAGFARQLGRSLPQAKQSFQAWTIANPANLRLGSVHAVHLSDDITVISMVAQDGYGDSESPRIRYSALGECLDMVCRIAQQRSASVHMPRIGLGQGGGTWALIAEEIRRTLCRRGSSVTVYTLPGEHEDAVMSQGRAGR